MCDIIPSTPNSTLKCPNKDLKTLEGRLSTFTNWPIPNILTAADLAKAGFYYTGHLDLVKCFDCGIEIFKWVPGDNPMSDHTKYCKAEKKVCSFLNNNNDLATDGARFGDECGKYDMGEESPTPLGVINKSKPCYPDYIHNNKRLESFKDWPKYMKQTPQELANAGFFYKGIGDHTQCFQCGVGLRDWDDSDVAWEQHAMWSPKCTYLLMVKGEEYVDYINNPNKNNVESVQKESDAKSNTSINETSENSTPQISTLCKICLSKEINVLFMPCKHLVACMGCASSVDTCPLCSQVIKSKTKTYFS